MPRRPNEKNNEKSRKSSNDFNDPFKNDPFFNDSLDHGFPFTGNSSNSISSIGSNSSIDSSFESMKRNMLGSSNAMRIMDKSIQGSSLESNNDNKYSTSYSMMTYSKVNDREPEIYKESRYSKIDGDLREDERKMMDTRNKIDKVHHMRRIGEKGHLFSMIRDSTRNNIDRQEDFTGFQEEELNDFNEEWVKRDNNNHRQRPLRIQGIDNQQGVHGKRAIRGSSSNDRYLDETKIKKRSSKNK